MIKQKSYCKSCNHHYTGGIKDGVHDNWCCKFSKGAIKAVGHCKNVQGKAVITAEVIDEQSLGSDQRN
jgi:hypothetical protein